MTDERPPITDESTVHGPQSTDEAADVRFFPLRCFAVDEILKTLNDLRLTT
jgi:hypothetical protein